MKAKNIDGNIIIYQTLPNDYKNYLNFKEASKDIIESEGFYDFILPELNNFQKLGNIFFNKEKLIYTYEIINKTEEELLQEKNII